MYYNGCFLTKNPSQALSGIVVEVLNTHHMIIITFFQKDSFGKEVGKRKWCETFAGRLARKLSRSGRLSFIFSKEKLIFSCFFGAFFVFFFGAFPALPSTKKSKKKNTIHSTKSTINSTIQSAKKAQLMAPKKSTTHSTKKSTTHSTKKSTTHSTKNAQFLAQKKHNS